MSQGDSAEAGGKFTVELVPARQGDCVLVEWPGEERRIRMLIDAGPARAYDSNVFCRLAALQDRRIDYLVVTHVDGDHVEGVVLLVRDADLDLSIGEVWYNGVQHLTKELGPAQGEILSALIKARELPWNTAFNRDAVCSPDGGPFMSKQLPGGVQVTVLAPDRPTLRALRDEWEVACKKAHINPGSDVDALRYLQTRPALSPRHVLLGREPMLDIEKLARTRRGVDTSVSNASSIVLLLEYGDERVLLAGDSTPRALLPAVRKVLQERNVDSLPLSVFKVPHHGSQNNITKELIEMLPARRYLISTDGSGRPNHPDDPAIATILKYGPPGLELIFNYDSARNRRWSDSRLVRKVRHRVTLPPKKSADSERKAAPS